MEFKQLNIIPEISDLKRSVEIAKKYNCGFEYQDFFIPDVLDNESKIKELTNTYLSNKLNYSTFHGAFFDVTIFSDDSMIKKVSDYRITQSLQIANNLGSKGIVFHTNYIANFNIQSYRNNWVTRNCEYWKKKLEDFPEIEIYIENMFDDTPDLLAELGREMEDEPRFGICFDYAHAHAFGDETKIDEWVEKLAPYVKHIHINDNNFESDLHLPVGDGKIDWEKFKINYEKYMCDASVLIEHKNNDNIKKSLDFLKKL